MNNIVFESKSPRFQKICKRFDQENIPYKVFNFDDNSWYNYDYSDIETIYLFRLGEINIVLF